MKAILFAAVMSLLSSSFFVHAQSDQVNNPLEASVIANEPNKINLNKADVDTLAQSFKGIGRKRAEAIIAFRESNGGFKTIDDLAQVKGIGKAFVERNRIQLSETYRLG